MINRLADSFEGMAEQLGLSIKIPRPTQATRGICSVTNGVIGIALMAAGTVVKKPAIVLLGAVGVVGAIVLVLDKN